MGRGDLSDMPDTEVGPVSAVLGEMNARGTLTPDRAQAETALALDAICATLQRPNRNTLVARLFKSSVPETQGAYIWGDVGRGKSLLMDLFFAAVPIPDKRRLHFHEFMDEVHEAVRVHRLTEKQTGAASDPIKAAVAEVIGENRLICLDEFQVRDITSAMLLQRIFEQVFAHGVTVVSTSNTEPDRLYENGLNRQLFTPFIALLKDRLQIIHLEADRDYRREALSTMSLFHFGGGDEGKKAMDAIWTRLCRGETATSATLLSLGRQITVPAQVMGAARFSFAQLCEKPLGARDYLRIARAFHTIVIDDVPQLNMKRLDAARRFIELIDTLYDNGVKLAASFAVPIDALAADERSRVDFFRCASRLAEMQSDAYISAPHLNLERRSA